MASGEDSLIARYFRPLATAPGALALADDAATLGTSGEDIVVTTDAIVEGVHFLADDPADTLARKALRVNLSDLAAKGADPAGFVLTLALRSASAAWLSAFAAGLGQDARQFACPLLGGDTVSTSGPLMISVTAFGRLPRGAMVRRAGAAAGDVVVVTGTIGDAALGLDLLTKGKVAVASVLDETEQTMLITRYRVPQPRNAIAPALRRWASAAMDVSDGLAGDLEKLCAVSAVAADVQLAAVPLSPSARVAIAAGAASLESLIAAGDDYEVLCTVPERNFEAFADAAADASVPISRIGRITPGSQAVRFIDQNGVEIRLSRRSYSHF